MESIQPSILLWNEIYLTHPRGLSVPRDGTYALSLRIHLHQVFGLCLSMPYSFYPEVYEGKWNISKYIYIYMKYNIYILTTSMVWDIFYTGYSCLRTKWAVVIQKYRWFECMAAKLLHLQDISLESCCIHTTAALLRYVQLFHILCTFSFLIVAASTGFNWYGNRSGETWQERAWLFRPFITVYCPSTNYRQSTALQPPTNLLPHDLTRPHAAVERQLWVDKDNL